MAEAGLTGFQVPGQELAEYRVHGRSMLQTITEAPGGKPRVVAEMTRRHPWLSIVDAKRQPARDDGAN
jgi:hypothetical protein